MHTIEKFKRLISLLISFFVLGLLMAFTANQTGLFKSTPLPTSSLAAGVPAGAGDNPVDNSCSGGYVTFTFDDGPSTYTQDVINTLVALKMKAIFFVIGNRVQLSPSIVAEEADLGMTVGDHTFNHRSSTGFGTPGLPALTGPQWSAELVSDANAIVAAGAPRPTLYRPPYDDINNYYNAIAAGDGLRVVMGYGNGVVNKVIDTADWSGLSSAQITSRVENGYMINGFHMPGLQNGSVVVMHDGQPTAPHSIAALPKIAAYMNQHNLCTTATPPKDATGGVVTNNPAPLHITPGTLPQEQFGPQPETAISAG